MWNTPAPFPSSQPRHALSWEGEFSECVAMVQKHRCSSTRGWCQVTNLPSFFRCNGPLSHSLTGCPACHHLSPLTSSNVALPTVLTHWVSSWFWTLIHTLGPLDLKFHSILTSLSFSSFNSALMWELRYQLFLQTLPLTGWGVAMESCLHHYHSIMWC